MLKGFIGVHRAYRVIGFIGFRGKGSVVVILHL